MSFCSSSKNVLDFPDGKVDGYLPINAGDMGLISGPGRSPRFQEDPPGSRKILFCVPQLLNLNSRAHVLQLPKPTFLGHALQQQEARTPELESSPRSLQLKKSRSESVCQWDSVTSRTVASLGSSAHGILQVRILKWVAILFSRGIFLIQGLKPGLLNCRQILYSLRHQGSPGEGQWKAMKTQHSQKKKKKEQFKNREEGDLKDALVGEGEGDCLDAERRQEQFGKGKPPTPSFWLLEATCLGPAQRKKDLVSREFDLHRKPIRKIQSLQKLHLLVIKRNLGLNYVDNCLHSPLHFACRYLPSEGYFEDK